MGKDSAIQWTDHTWPVTAGCDDASPGCLNCYSKQGSYRMGLNPNPKVSGAYGGTVESRGGMLRWTGLLRPLPDRLDWPARWKTPARVFVGNMSDLFHPDVPDEFIDRVFAAMAVIDRHTYQVLTKRADRMADYLSTPGRNGAWGQHAYEMARRMGIAASPRDPAWLENRERIVNTPLANVHVGVSVENRKHGLPRVAAIRDAPAALRFLSVEPLTEDLGEINLTGIGWCVVGGESGSKSRPFELDWARSIRDQCREQGVAFFMKQAGSNPWENTGELVSEGVVSPCLPVKYRHSHGGDLSELPEDLRIREFPTPQPVA